MSIGRRNRAAGNGFERELAQVFRLIGFPHVVTTRAESRTRDAQKIDLINKDEYLNGRFPYNVQAKNVKGHLKYGKLLSEIPNVSGVMNVVIHKQTEKVNGRFVTKDKFAILKMEDFLTLVQQRDEQRNVIQMVSPPKPRARKRVFPKVKGTTTSGVSNKQGIPTSEGNIQST